MNKLLPVLSELKPISGNRDVFGQTVFTKEFESLNFEEKLQVACDLVRQTMLNVEIPNPENDRETMIGDSYTSCNVLKEYLIFNHIGVKHHVVFAKSNILKQSMRLQSILYCWYMTIAMLVIKLTHHHMLDTCAEKPKN